MKTTKPAGAHLADVATPPSSPRQSANGGRSQNSSSQQYGSPTSSPIPSTVSAHLDDDGLCSLSDDFASLYDNFELKIATQPPSKTVYQRILKPFPSVVLAPKVATSDDEGPALLATLANAAANTGAPTTALSRSAAAARDAATLLNSAHHVGLFVEASLVRSDTGAPVAKCLDGNSMTRFERSTWNGGVLTATFKKLKILSTSQQLQGALLRLKFTLKKYTGTTFATVNIPNRAVLSQPIEVFSHSQYLHKKKEKRSKSESEDRRSSDDDDDNQRQQHQGRDSKMRKIEHDSVHVNLIAAIKAFKEQGGTKDMLVRCIDACYSDEDPTRRHSAPSPFTQWEITMENPSRRYQRSNSSSHHEPHNGAHSTNGNNGSGWQAQREPAAAIAFSTTTTTTTTTSKDDERRRAKGRDSPVQSSQPCLPPLRQELGAVLQATQPQTHHHHASHSLQAMSEAPSHADHQRSHRGSLPDGRGSYHSYPHNNDNERSSNGDGHRSAAQSYHDAFTSSRAAPPPPRQPSNILPSLSSLLLLPSASPSAPPAPLPHHRAVPEPAVVASSSSSAPPAYYQQQTMAQAHLPRPLIPAARDYSDLGKRKRELWHTPAHPCTFV